MMAYTKELYNIDTIYNYIGDISVSVLLNQVSNYTKRQISILHEIPEPLPKKLELLRLYDKATKLSDDNALEILLEKYNIDKYFLTEEDLPKLTNKECEDKVNEVLDIIKDINPKVDVSSVYKEKNKKIYKKYITRQFFKRDLSTNQMYFDSETYLNALPRYSLEWASHWLNLGNIMKLTDEELIKAILSHKDKNGVILKCIKHHCGGIYFKMYVIEMLENGGYLIQ